MEIVRTLLLINSFLAIGILVFILIVVKKPKSVPQPKIRNITVSHVSFPLPYTINKNVAVSIMTSSQYKGYILRLKNPNKLITVLNERGYFREGKGENNIKVVLSDDVKKVPPNGVKTIVLAKPPVFTNNSSEFFFYVTPALIKDKNVNKEFLSYFLSTALSHVLYSDSFIQTEVNNSLSYLGNDTYFDIQKE